MIILETLSSDRISYNFDVKGICHGIKLQTFGFFPELLDIFNLIGLFAVQVRLILLKIMFYLQKGIIKGWRKRQKEKI
jgi:hypothetical protein